MALLDINELRFQPADYRVRLYLSVDLSGSTAFKNSEAGTGRGGGASPKWVTVFQSFYGDFPTLFQSNFQGLSVRIMGDVQCPELWKAVGDELVFCGVVPNKKAVMVALNAFVRTLTDYRKRLSDLGLPLDVKGAAWLGAFPEPNRAVQLRKQNTGPDFLSASEALELSADHKPFDFDFLGKAIDTGFRVASLASPQRFALSVQLARLLVSMRPGESFDHHIHFDAPLLLKGVNKGIPYPFLYLETVAHLETAEVLIRERRLLGGRPTDRTDLVEYLNEYCRVAGTDEIMLPHDSDDVQPQLPPSYAEHRDRIAEHLRQEQGREPQDADPDEDAATDEGEVDIAPAEDLDPLPEVAG